MSLSTNHLQRSPPLIRPVALDLSDEAGGVTSGPTVSMQFLGEVGEDEVADVLAHDGGELEELRDDAGEVQVCFGVAVHVGHMLQELVGEGAGVYALIGRMFAGCVSGVFGRGVLVGAQGWAPLGRLRTQIQSCQLCDKQDKAGVEIEVSAAEEEA